MKTTLLVVLLAFSIAANAAFFFQRTVSSAPAAVRNPGIAQAGSANPPDPAAEAAIVTQAEVAQLAKTWARLQSGDVKTLVERLRAAGFSETMIRSIVAAQVNERFSARRKALLAQQEETPYWQSLQQFGLDPKTRSAFRELNREQTEQVKALLGPDGLLGNEERLAYQRRQFGDIPADKIDQLQNIISDYSDLRQQIQSNANGVLLPEDREKLTLLEKEQRADLAGLLTPQELENYELRSSSTASQLRSQLGIFKPSEAEFVAIFRATRAAEEQFGSLSNTSGNFSQYQQIRTAALEQAKAQLTPERYAALQQATDPAYSTINRLVARLDLPTTAAVQVVSVQQDTMKRANAIRSDKGLSADQRAVQLSALAQEASTTISQALGGTRGLEAYKQYGGQWLQSLQPRPVTPPKG